MLLCLLILHVKLSIGALSIHNSVLVQTFRHSVLKIKECLKVDICPLILTVIVLKLFIT